MEISCETNIFECLSRVKIFLKRDIVLLYTAIGVYVLLVISLFGLLSAILMHLLPLLGICFVCKKISHIHTIGIVNYLSNPIQELLLHRSIFDILCEIWFVPKITLYLKRFALPFFIKMNREEAYEMFNELNPDFAKALDTKGVVNILPQPIYNIIMPYKSPLKAEISPINGLEALSEPIQAPESGLIHVMSFDSNDQVVRITSKRTELLGSGSRADRIKPVSHNKIDEKIKEITQKIPTLQPVMGKILGNKFRSLMGLVSQKSLVSCTVASGLAILLQIIVSKQSRALSLVGIKIALFICAFSTLGFSILGLFIKYLHKQVEEPKKSEEIDSQQSEELGHRKYPSMRRIIEERTKIKSRFNTKGDKRSFFSPDLNMAL
ncbi:unnamed protein product [Blepharisma stoltei]|uniref:Uncharacterized protein n=1 Tax=Blepharisma stoltei TaxID=1481888 RepID=A0AAU9INV6_9CILI|nr:unnamed protein product [Blepharisma stoltei]